MSAKLTDLGGVIGGTKDELRSAVVARADVGDVWLARNQNLSTAEITKLEDASVGVKQEILRLDVTVTDTHGMNVGEGAKELIDVELDLDDGHCRLQFAKVAGRTVHSLRDIFKNEVEIDLLLLQR